MMFDQPVMPVRARGVGRISANAVAINANPARHGPTSAIERYRYGAANPAYVDRELHIAALVLKRMVRHSGSHDASPEFWRTGS
ncbi:hypothetical protein [Limoniibacter endophyticus]|nr:hypothetical protein [Limoniibacter endophyticus]